MGRGQGHSHRLTMHVDIAAGAPEVLESPNAMSMHGSRGRPGVTMCHRAGLQAL